MSIISNLYIQVSINKEVFFFLQQQQTENQYIKSLLNLMYVHIHIYNLKYYIGTVSVKISVSAKKKSARK